ncbi:MAG: MBL fold metallo-hydrolase [Clostridia bacterium]|nr:MBL fold metallo-hydrolase [Clostridia bacterium]
MKLTFIGTSDGIPRADRYCTCMMLETGGSVYLIDAGAPVCDIFPRMGRSIEEIRAIFNTHIHADHAEGIYRIADLVNGYYKNHEMDIYVADAVYSEQVIGLIEMASGHPGTKFDRARVRFSEIDVAKPYEDENIKVSYFPTGHIDKPYHSYAMLVEAEGKRLLFTGDLSKNLRDDDIPTVAFEEGMIDLMVCEFAHIRPEYMMPYLPRIKAKRVFFNHTTSEEKIAMVREMNGKYSFAAAVPSDGDTVEL